MDRYVLTGSLSLVASTASSLCSRLLFQIGRDLRNGSFLDLPRRSHPTPLQLAAVDLRSPSPAYLDSLLRSLDCQMPYWVLESTKKTADAILDDAFEASSLFWDPTPGPRLLLIRGLQRLFPESANYHHDVMRLIQHIQDHARDQQCAVLASTAASRPQKGRVSDSRSRIYGSTMWSEGVDDLLLLDYVKAGMTLTISRDGWADVTRRIQYLNDEFVLDTSVSPEPTSIPDRLIPMLPAIPANTAISSADIRALLSPTFVVSERSWTRFFNDAVDVGLLRRVSKGLYIRPATVLH